MDEQQISAHVEFFVCKSYYWSKKKEKDCSEKEAIECPNIVYEYNKKMGGVDIMDQKKCDLPIWL